MEKSDINIHVGSQIKKRRKQTGISAAYLAEVTGLTIVSISNIENGKQNPSLYFLMTFCGLIGCTPNDLLPEVVKIEIDRDALLNKAKARKIAALEKRLKALKESLNRRV